MNLFKKLTISVFFSIGLIGQSYAAECIAPANPGGGWDFTCRSISKIMTDIGAYDGSIKVTNMAGGGGGLAYAHVVNERNYSCGFNCNSYKISTKCICWNDFRSSKIFRRYRC